MITLENVYKYFDRRLVLENVSAVIPSGKITGIVGPNGTGKTTMLRIIAGLEKPDKGRVHVSSKVGFVPQDDLLLPWKTIRENVELGLIFKGIPIEDVSEKVKWTYDILGLHPHLNKYPKEASGGTRRKAAIARSLLLDADILLLDEPFTGLDLDTVMNLGELLLKLKETGKTLVVVSHQLWELARIADLVLVMTGPPGKIEWSIELNGLSEQKRFEELIRLVSRKL